MDKTDVIYSICFYVLIIVGVVVLITAISHKTVQKEQSVKTCLHYVVANGTRTCTEYDK